MIVRIAEVAAGIMMALALIAAVAFALGYLKTYDAVNAGIIFGNDTWTVGYEWRGVPGFFVNNWI